MVNEKVKETLAKLKEMADMFKNSPVQFDEENTKNALILPFFDEVLGHETRNPFEFQAEQRADSRVKGNEKVDYSIIVEGEPKVIIEAKRFNKLLSEDFGQLARYFSVEPTIRYGILTNGMDYYFFTDTEHANIMDKEPFYRLNIENVSDEDLDFLKHFTKESVFGGDDALREYIAKGKLNNYLKGLFEQPTDAFVEFIKQHSKINAVTKEDIQAFGTGVNTKPVAPQVNPPSIVGVTMSTLPVNTTNLPVRTANPVVPKGVKKIQKNNSINVLKMDVELRGHKFTTKVWVDMFIRCLEALIQINPTAMASMDRLFPENRVQKFSYDINDFPLYGNVLQAKQLSNGLYVFTKLSSDSIQKILDTVIELCGLSKDELKVTKHLKDGTTA